MHDEKHVPPDRVPAAPLTETDPPLEGPVRELESELAEPEHIHIVPLDFEPYAAPIFHLEPLSGPTEASEEPPPPVTPEE